MSEADKKALEFAQAQIAKLAPVAVVEPKPKKVEKPAAKVEKPKADEKK